MPKMKRNSGMKKRVKVTGTGKLVHKHGRRRTHMMQKQNTARTRLESGDQPIAKADVPRVKRMLGL
ncbi:MULTISPECIES: large ribosomal subunit protein bL35 [Mumia]|uniref:large ribosomal subunit protein bL35 n=1 Tax=Mumia TaxID=1546255 RepID=UPI001422E448|nr:MULTISPECIES: 50S ribosomal protein L35 [Mumia]QMW68004.1 50S ribosomal protein L35 [Mumia sp. ZJ1417]